MNAWRERWALSPDVTYLNHGSFGASPRVVLEARAKFATELAAEPVDFLVRQAPGRLLAVRERLAALVGAKAGDLILTDNATAGMNLVARSLPLTPGDEVLLCDHEYGAVLRLWRKTCARAGATLNVVKLPWPLASPEQVAQSFAAAISARTRLVVVSHVTSPTALILPVAEVVRVAHAQGIAVAIDGPHALAMLPLDLTGLGADFYTASCHKWLAAPLGTGFLHVAPRWQHCIDPLITSWGGDNARPERQAAG
jgi:isopenicillin-N epimerase